VPLRQSECSVPTLSEVRRGAGKSEKKMPERFKSGPREWTCAAQLKGQSNLGAVMHNDSKLGLLAGVGGVVVAAVLATQNPPPSPPASAAATKEAPRAAATPATPAGAHPPATAVHRKPDLTGTTTSRSRDDDVE
jgi:hypothetical protein